MEASPSAENNLPRCMRGDAEEARTPQVATSMKRASEDRRRDLLFPKTYMPHPYLSYDGAGSEAFEKLLSRQHEQGGGPTDGLARGVLDPDLGHAMVADVRVVAVVSWAVEGDCAPSLRPGRSFSQDHMRTVVPWKNDELVASTAGGGETIASRHCAVLEGLNRDNTALFEARP